MTLGGKVRQRASYRYYANVNFEAHSMQLCLNQINFKSLLDDYETSELFSTIVNAKLLKLFLCS